MAELAASLQIGYIKKIFECWKDIESTMSKQSFEENEDEAIDIFDIKCKLWGFLLRHVHGVSLGGGDYIHLVVEHAAAQLRMHRSLKIYSNQGFEASHKEHRALYSRASSHDKVDVSQSLEQITVHWLSRMMLSLRLQFHNAQVAIDEGKKYFHYRGCEWKKKEITWTKEEKSWIKRVNLLFTKLYGPDTLTYEFVRGKGTRVSEDSDPRESFRYVHSSWEAQFTEQCDKKYEATSSNTPSKETPPASAKKVRTTLNFSSKSTPPEGESVRNSTKTTSSHHQPSTPPESLGRSSKTTPVIVIDIFFDSSLTRKQFADISIPPVGYNSYIQRNITKCYGPFVETDPLSIPVRPPEGAVMSADDEIRSDKDVLAVVIGNFGCFSRHGISVLLKMCDVRRVQLEIDEEQLWLARDGALSSYEKKAIQGVLWNSKLSQTLLMAGSKSIDVLSFATLAKERYLDNFIIDTFITKVIQDERCNGNERALYLPSEMFAWLESSDNDFKFDKFSHAIGSTDLSKCEIVMVPVHMNGSHWGLFVVDVIKQRFLFDDGLRKNLDSHVLSSVKCALDMLFNVKPNAVPLQTRFWDSIKTPHRFGMPFQGISSSTGEGSGSCGVGVVLSALDFIVHGLSIAGKFDWNFGQMSHLRKMLMLTIVKWIGHTPV